MDELQDLRKTSASDDVSQIFSADDHRQADACTFTATTVLDGSRTTNTERIAAVSETLQQVHSIAQTIGLEKLLQVTLEQCSAQLLEKVIQGMTGKQVQLSRENPSSNTGSGDSLNRLQRSEETTEPVPQKYADGRLVFGSLPPAAQQDLRIQSSQQRTADGRLIFGSLPPADTADGRLTFRSLPPTE